MWASEKMSLSSLLPFIPKGCILSPCCQWRNVNSAFSLITRSDKNILVASRENFTSDFFISRAENPSGNLLPRRLFVLIDVL